MDGKETERLAQKLREARTQTELTQEEVSDRLKIHRQALSDIERGRRRVTAQEIFLFAKLYGKPWDWFLAEEPSQDAEEEETVFLRATRLAGEARRGLKSFLQSCREYEGLEEMAQESPSAAFRPLEREISSFENCWALAEEERNRLGLGEAPGNRFQETLEERLGVKLVFEELPRELSGASWLSPRYGPCVLVNRTHSEGRRHWTLAHEYFHLLRFSAARSSGFTMRSSPGTESRVAESSPSDSRFSTAFQSCRAEKSEEKKPREEQLADQFAAAFLLPEGPLTRRVAELGRNAQPLRWEDLSSVALHFGVSMEALLWRLVNLKVLSKGVPEKYRRSPDGIGFAQKARSNAFGDEPSSIRLERIVCKLYLKGEISGGRLAEILRCDRADVDSIVSKYRPPSEHVGEFPYCPS